MINHTTVIRLRCSRCDNSVCRPRRIEGVLYPNRHYVSPTSQKRLCTGWQKPALYIKHTEEVITEDEVYGLHSVHGVRRMWDTAKEE